jgi:hypothetical protein
MWDRGCLSVFALANLAAWRFLDSTAGVGDYSNLCLRDRVGLSPPGIGRRVFHGYGAVGNVFLNHKCHSEASFQPTRTTLLSLFVKRNIVSL